MKLLTNKNAVITGGSDGIGHLLTQQLLPCEHHRNTLKYTATRTVTKSLLGLPLNLHKRLIFNK